MQQRRMRVCVWLEEAQLLGTRFHSTTERNMFAQCPLHQPYAILDRSRFGMNRANNTAPNQI